MHRNLHPASKSACISPAPNVPRSPPLAYEAQSLRSLACFEKTSSLAPSSWMPVTSTRSSAKASSFLTVAVLALPPKALIRSLFLVTGFLEPSCLMRICLAFSGAAAVCASTRSANSSFAVHSSQQSIRVYRFYSSQQSIRVYRFYSSQQSIRVYRFYSSQQSIRVCGRVGCTGVFIS